jgi:hypothetical protein
MDGPYVILRQYLSGTETRVVFTYPLMSGVVDFRLRKRIEEVNFRDVGHEYPKRGCVVVHTTLAVMLRSFNGSAAVCTCICRRRNGN